MRRARCCLRQILGIVIGIIGGPKYAAADDIGAIVASLVICYNAWNIFRPAFHEIMVRTTTMTNKSFVASIREAAKNLQNPKRPKATMKACFWVMTTTMTTRALSPRLIARPRVGRNDRIRQSWTMMMKMMTVINK